MNHPIFLAADIGATKTNIGLYTFSGRLTAYSQTVQLKTADFSGLEALLAEFLLSQRAAVSFGVFGVPGSVDN
jgi:glucokinase